MPATPTDVSARYRYVIVALGFCNVMASIGFTRFAYTMIMPPMRAGLDLPYTAMGTIGTVGFTMYMLAGPPLGALAARLGMRRTISLALGTASLGLFGLALAPGFWSALLANVVVQVASAAANIAGFVVAMPWFPPRQRGFATGVVVGGVGAGILVVGRTLPPILASGPSGWRAAWATVGAMTLLTAAAMALFLRDHPDASWSAFRARTGALAAWRELVGMRALWVTAVIGLLFGFEYIIFGTFFAVHLTLAGRTIDEAGRLWSLVGVLMVSSGLIGGALSDRIGRLPAQAVLMAAQAAAAACLAASTAGAGLQVAIVLYGCTVMGSTAVAGAFMTDVVGPARASSAIGFTNLVFGAGQALGPLVAGLLVDATGTVAAALLTAAAAAIVAAGVAAVAARTFPG
jgi:predicted MFS family arabinose efflux permease